MAISTSIDFTATRDDIITEALEQLGVLGEGEIPNDDQIASSSRTLNMIIKAWQADSLNLFAVDTLYLFPTAGETEYVVNGVSATNITRNFAQTTIGTDATSGDTTLTVDDASDIAEQDYIGIQLADNTLHWSTVTLINGDDVTIADAIPEDIPANAIVVAYTTKANRPMKLLECYYKTLDSNINIPVLVTPRRTYDAFTTTASGIVTSVYFDSLLMYPKIKIWPSPDTELGYLRIVVQKTLADVDLATDNFELPQEWLMPLAYALALALTTKHGVPPSTYQQIEREAVRYYEMARGFDSELYTSVYFQPNNNGQF